MKTKLHFLIIVCLMKISAVEAQHFQHSLGGVFEDGVYKMIDGLDGGLKQVLIHRICFVVKRWI